MRQSPLLLVYKAIQLARNGLFFFLLLFVVNAASTATWAEAGRAVFWYVIALRLVYIVLDWSCTTFQLHNEQLTKRSGLFSRKTQQVPVAQLEQMTIQKNWFHRVTNTVACSYQLIDANEVLKIDMLAPKQLQRLQQTTSQPANAQHVIFQPTKKQLIKASFTSCRFLLAIPFLATLYSYVDHIVQLERYTAQWLQLLQTNARWLVGTLIGYLVVSISCAIGFTFIKFGRDRVMKADDALIIRKGVLAESNVTVQLAMITGVEVRQSFLKRLFGLAEVRLQFKSTDANELQSIFPYFEYAEAIAFIHDYFPQFALSTQQHRLQRAALMPRLLRATVLVACSWLVCWLVREWLPFAYYWLGAVLSVLLLLGAWSAYAQFRYSVENEQLQLRHGIFNSYMTTIRFQHICDMVLEQSILQRVLGLRTLTIHAYTDKGTVYSLHDVQAEEVERMYAVYVEAQCRAR